MNCPKCNSANVYVIDSRHYENAHRRRRKCENCGNRWSTMEISLEEYQQLQATKASYAKIQAIIREETTDD